MALKNAGNLVAADPFQLLKNYSETIVFITPKDQRQCRRKPLPTLKNWNPATYFNWKATGSFTQRLRPQRCGNTGTFLLNTASVGNARRARLKLARW